MPTIFVTGVTSAAIAVLAKCLYLPRILNPSRWMCQPQLLHQTARLLTKNLLSFLTRPGMFSV